MGIPVLYPLTILKRAFDFISTKENGMSSSSVQVAAILKTFNL